MSITVTITKPNTFDQFGRLLAVGSSQSLPDDLAISLVQQLRATDTNGVMSFPFSAPFEFGGVFTANGDLIGFESDMGIAPLGASVLTWANRPSLASNVRGAIYASDVGGGNYFDWNGTRYKPVNGMCTLDTIDTANSAVANTTEQNLNPNHRVIPAGVIQGNDRIRLFIGASKNGGVDTSTIRVRFGPLGTIADPVIATIAGLAAANLTFGTIMEFKRISATTIQKQGSGDTNASYGGASAVTYPAAVTVSNMDTTAMFLSITSQMTAGTEITTLQDYTLELFATDS